MSHKSERIAEFWKPFEGRRLDARYLAYFECFNQQRFFEAHEVLEELWLPRRRNPESVFYKGLIQLAGAFVHVQKRRTGPALALFRLAQANLQQFPALHEGLDLQRVLGVIELWIGRLANPGPDEPLSAAERPSLRLPFPIEPVEVAR
jgi:predicted metal-dependent hydrolase